MGKINPTEYNSMLTQVLQKNYTELFADFRKSSLKKARFQETTNYGSEVFHSKQAMEYYIVENELELVDGKGFMPEDLFLINSVFDEKSQYEKTDMKVFNMLTRLESYTPTTCSPIYTLNSNKIKAYPAKDKIDITYFRRLKLPKWTFTIVGSEELFNPDAPDFQDIDAHEMMIGKIFADILFMCGVNLQMQEVQQYAMQMKQEEMVNQQ